MKTMGLWAGLLPLVVATTAMAGEMPAVDWAGFSIGGVGGYSWGHADHSVHKTSNGSLLSTGSTSSSGFSGGARFEYDFDVAPHVVTGFGVTAVVSGESYSAPGGAVSSSSQSDWALSLHGRLGYAAGRTLLYGLAGWHWGWGSATRTQNSGVAPSGTAAPFSETVGTTSSGWTIGVGVEYAFSQHWTGFLEYSHLTNLGSTTTFPVAGVYSNVSSSSDSIHSGISYKF